MKAWLNAEWITWITREGTPPYVTWTPSCIEFAAEKPPALLTIDDRAIRFDGNWADPSFDPATLRAFKPWNAPSKAAS